MTSPDPMMMSYPADRFIPTDPKVRAILTAKRENRAARVRRAVSRFLLALFGKLSVR